MKIKQYEDDTSLLISKVQAEASDLDRGPSLRGLNQEPNLTSLV